LGLPILTDDVTPYIRTGVKFPTPGPNTVPTDFVSSLAGGSTADVLSSTLLPGGVGAYQIVLHLNSGLVTQPNTLVTIAQDTYVSNQVAFPVVNPQAFVSAEPNFTIVCQHVGNFALGQNGANYIVTVSNAGSGNPSNGVVTVSEAVPVGLTLVTMVGDGWNCNGTTCTRSDALPAGAAYPVITIIVNVASNAATSVVNGVHVTGGGSAAATSDDTTTITGSPASNPPVLTVVSKHSGNFSHGQAGATYTLTVSNASSAHSTSGLVTVNELVPAGLTLVSTGGTGWACNADSCTRSDSLGGGSSYPPITVTVNVSATAPSSVINQAVVSGGGGPASVSSGDVTTIKP
jgi:uncharacterized repeat protein (TIGR01451 family)